MQHLYNNEFIQKDIFPIKIIETQGSITNADSLLKNKELQITTNEEDVTSLKNSTLQRPFFNLLRLREVPNNRILFLPQNYPDKI